MAAEHGLRRALHHQMPTMERDLLLLLPPHNFIFIQLPTAAAESGVDVRYIGIVIVLLVLYLYSSSSSASSCMLLLLLLLPARSLPTQLISWHAKLMKTDEKENGQVPGKIKEDANHEQTKD